MQQVYRCTTQFETLALLTLNTVKRIASITQDRRNKKHFNRDLFSITICSWKIIPDDRVAITLSRLSNSEKKPSPIGCGP